MRGFIVLSTLRNWTLIIIVAGIGIFALVTGNALGRVVGVCLLVLDVWVAWTEVSRRVS